MTKIISSIIAFATMIFSIFGGVELSLSPIVDIDAYFSEYGTQYFNNDGFIFEIQDADSTVEALGLGHAATEFNSASGQERMARAEEWGYSLTHLDGITDGCGRVIKSTFKNLIDRKDAIEKISLFLENQYKSKSISGVYYSMNGHYPWHHYAGENGFTVLGSEIGEGINNYQWHIALNRGAAKQYNAKWFVDFSMWHSGYIRDTTGKWGESSLPEGGHSLNLFERSMLMSYMSGAGGTVAEGGNTMCFDSDGKITDYANTCKKLQTFFSKNPNIGNSYVPFGIVLDYYHGIYHGIDEKCAFNTFAYNAGDEMTDRLINHIWDNGIEIGSDEARTLVNNGKGDLYDVLLQNAPQEVLDMYPCLILSGSIDFSEQETERYYQYVNSGGTLLVNTAYLDDLTEFADFARYKFTDFGSGRVFVYGSDYSIFALKRVLSYLTKEYVPFSFNSDVQYIINYDSQSRTIYLTVINNNGISKPPQSAVEINERKAVDLKIGYRGKAEMISAQDIYGDCTLVTKNDRLYVTLAPGEISVIKILLGDNG